MGSGGVSTVDFREIQEEYVAVTAFVLMGVAYIGLHIRVFSCGDR